MRDTNIAWIKNSCRYQSGLPATYTNGSGRRLTKREHQSIPSSAKLWTKPGRRGGRGRRGRVPDEKRGDRVYTPDWCAADMVQYFKPRGLILEPCRGDGAIMKHLLALDKKHSNVSWCELDEGVDFFSWSDDVDWIITNPPYSKLRPFMQHAFRLADEVCFLVPARNVFSGYGTVREAIPAFGIRAIRWYGTGNILCSNWD